MSSAGTTEADRNGQGRVTRDDIAAKLRELQGDVDEGIESARNVAVVLAAVGVTVVVVAAYWFGRRRGRRRTAVLEIRRL